MSYQKFDVAPVLDKMHELAVEGNAGAAGVFLEYANGSEHAEYVVAVLGEMYELAVEKNIGAAKVFLEHANGSEYPENTEHIVILLKALWLSRDPEAKNLFFHYVSNPKNPAAAQKALGELAVKGDIVAAIIFLYEVHKADK